MNYRIIFAMYALAFCIGQKVMANQVEFSWVTDAAQSLIERRFDSDIEVKKKDCGNESGFEKAICEVVVSKITKFELSYFFQRVGLLNYKKYIQIKTPSGGVMRIGLQGKPEKPSLIFETFDRDANRFYTSFAEKSFTEELKERDDEVTKGLKLLSIEVIEKTVQLVFEYSGMVSSWFYSLNNHSFTKIECEGWNFDLVQFKLTGISRHD
ncbi:MAG: hypothetical protein KDD48_04195 [Bdellovibrionales bacterium]|nr:hypothetical protein [Bdellovibrionales bacterium]